MSSAIDTAPDPEDGGGTSARILDVAQRLAQTRGFNAFSYADISAEVGLTKAALHYHFPSKAALGEALIGRYTARFLGALDEIDLSGADPARCLRSYVDLYAKVLAEDRMCLCGVLAADYDTLPDAMQREVIRFFDLNETWLAGVLERGLASGTLRFAGAASEEAQLIVGTLEGAMLVARTYHDQRRFAGTAERLLTELGAADPA